MHSLQLYAFPQHARNAIGWCSTRPMRAYAIGICERARASRAFSLHRRPCSLVCGRTRAQAGSTSFYFWLYHALAGLPWPHSGPPWIQDVTSERWANLSGVRVARFAALPLRQRGTRAHSRTESVAYTYRVRVRVRHDAHAESDTACATRSDAPRGSHAASIACAMCIIGCVRLS